MVLSEIGREQRVSRIVAHVLFSQTDCGTVSAGSLNAPSRCPVVRIAKVAPYFITFRIKLHCSFKVRRGLCISPHLKVSGAQIGEGVGRRPNAQGLFEERNGFAILALKGSDTAKVREADEAVRHEGSHLTEHRGG